MKNTMVIRSADLPHFEQKLVTGNTKVRFPLSNDYLVFQAPEMQKRDTLPDEVRLIEEQWRGVRH